jgi:hypothetical protein
MLWFFHTVILGFRLHLHIQIYWFQHTKEQNINVLHLSIWEGKNGPCKTTVLKLSEAPETCLPVLIQRLIFFVPDINDYSYAKYMKLWSTSE